MIVAVASGKGGTGKTTVAVNLAKALGEPVQLLDCDVEAPNAHLFLAGTCRDSVEVTLPVPVVDAARCDGCGECSRFCQYHAIVSFGTEPLVFAELCHGCGGCALVCPQRAISETGRRIGVVETLTAGPITLIQGRLDVGVPAAPPLIRAVRQRGRDDLPALIDAPPGTSCPVIAAVRGADYLLLVTEPTPFGLHDLTLAAALARELELPHGVVINRAGAGDRRVQEWCAQQGIPILLEIPDDRRIAEAYAEGALLIDALPAYRPLFARLGELVMTPREA